MCLITLNRPGTDNVLDAATLRELPLAWETFRADDALRVAIFTGAGDKAFCGGVDITDIRSAPAPRYLKRDEGVRTYTSKQNKCWKPVIAAINGFVAGPGLHFILDADICIAVPRPRSSTSTCIAPARCPCSSPSRCRARFPPKRYHACSCWVRTIRSPPSARPHSD